MRELLTMTAETMPVTEQRVAVNDRGEPYCANCCEVIESPLPYRMAYPDEKWLGAEGWMAHVHQNEKDCIRALGQRQWQWRGKGGPS
jgi:hypothetical protein